MTFHIKRNFTSVVGVLTVFLSMPQAAFGHGTMLIPESRIYKCRFLGNPENHQDPACRAAIDLGGKQPIYDWNGVRQAEADSRHQEIIPDGQLCSGGNPTFRGMDLPRVDWRASPIAPDENGQFEFVYYATAPHATKDHIFYVTKENWDPTAPLKWDDVEQFCQLGGIPLETMPDGKRVYRMACELPQRSGRHVVFHIWQRSDSPEAFYACIDVEFTGGTDNGWKQIGRVVAVEDLPVDTILTFRLFDSNFSEVEQIEMTVQAGQGARDLWPFYLAQEVNAMTNLARIGVLDEISIIEPVQEADGNFVYIQPDSDLNFVIDKDIPSNPDPVSPPQAVVDVSDTELIGAGALTVSGLESSDPNGLDLAYNWEVFSCVTEPGSLQDPNASETVVSLDNPEQNSIVIVQLTVDNGERQDTATALIDHKSNGENDDGEFDFAYPDGIGSYGPGTIVKGTDGNLYQCKPFPFSGWCNQSPPHYAPGTGSHWQDAWTLL